MNFTRGPWVITRPTSATSPDLAGEQARRNRAKEPRLHQDRNSDEKQMAGRWA